MSWWESKRDPVREALKKARQLRLGDTVQVGDVVKVLGTARADGPLLRAPLSNAGRCVLWETAVETLIGGKRVLDDRGGDALLSSATRPARLVGARHCGAGRTMTEGEIWLPLARSGG